MNKSKVLVGMSGGVDSAVSAALLYEQGYEVVGAFMKNWSSCDWRADQRDATRVAAKLGIPFVTFDFEKEYREAVVDDMFRQFEAGRTPNPDVLCNKYIKFDRFVREADRLGCAYVATGHYARVLPRSIPPLPNPSERTFVRAEGGLAFEALRSPSGSRRGGVAQNRRGRGVNGVRRGCAVELYSGLDPNKDQSYFLWAINPTTLPRVLFPIGEMTKPQVREKARELGLEVADKKDSTGICFVGEVDMRTFLQERLPKNPGNVVTFDGNVIGTHEGLAFYTLGQREGLGIGGGTPYYVVQKRLATNEIVVASNFHPALYRSELTASQLNWFEKPEIPFTCKARIRYRQELQDCTISAPLLFKEGLGVVSMESDGVSVVFSNPQRAVTPGQSIVFYDGDKVLGGGIID